MLAERGVTFDVCAETAPLLRHVPTLAERHPALGLVVDHLGKPPIRARGWQPWADLLAAAAEAPNATARVSGLNTPPTPLTAFVTGVRRVPREWALPGVLTGAVR